MEAFAADMATMRTEIRGHDDRIKSLHKRVGEVQIHQGDQQAEIKVLANEVEEARTDIGEVKGQIHELSDSIDRKMQSMQEGFDRKFESLTNAVKWGTMALIALIGVLIPVLLK